MSACDACPDCGGTGWEWTHFAPGMSAYAPPEKTTCWACGGSGQARTAVDVADLAIRELSALRERGA